MKPLYQLAAAMLLLCWQPVHAQQIPGGNPNAQVAAQIQAMQNQALLRMNPMLRAQVLRYQMQAQYYQRLQQAQILSRGSNGSGYISAEQQARLEALARQRGNNP